MVFRFKDSIASCNEFSGFQAGDIDTLCLMFPNCTKEIDLRAGAKEYIYFKLVNDMNKGDGMTSLIDLSEWELD